MLPRKITIISLAIAISLLGDATLYTVLPTYAEQLNIKLALVGVLLSVNRFVRLFTNSWSGYIHDKSHSPWPFVMALILGACTTAMYGLLWGFWIFLIARLLWGACWSFIRLEGYTAVIIEAPPNSRGKMMGAYKSISTSGMMAGGFLGGVLTDTIGYRNCLLSFAFLSLMGAFALFWEQLRNRKNQSGAAIPTMISRSVQETETVRTQDLSHKSHNIQASERWMFYLMGFMNILVNGGIIGSTLGRLLKIRFGMTISFFRVSVGVASATGLLVLIRRAIFLLFAPIFGHLADRIGRRFVLIFGFTIVEGRTQGRTNLVGETL